MADEPVRRPRPAARILLVDPVGRVLLFRFVPGDDRPPFWCTPGGAVEPGESYAAAAVRELHEETGMDLPCGPEVARRLVEFVTLEQVPVIADERYFLVRTDRTEILTHGHTALERSVMRDWNWFDADGILRLDELFFPDDLAAIMADLGIWHGTVAG
jgi:8-oxo-dGTP pyrophosphatase MutT (NUDIX family)